jgi:hypothetical protein
MDRTSGQPQVRLRLFFKNATTERGPPVLGKNYATQRLLSSLLNHKPQVIFTTLYVVEDAILAGFLIVIRFYQIQCYCSVYTVHCDIIPSLQTNF